PKSPSAGPATARPSLPRFWVPAAPGSWGPPPARPIFIPPPRKPPSWMPPATRGPRTIRTARWAPNSAAAAWPVAASPPRHGDDRFAAPQDFARAIDDGLVIAGSAATVRAQLTAMLRASGWNHFAG